MLISSVDQELTPAGLRPPDLAALRANVDTYRVLLAQPAGAITADAAGVRNRDAVRADLVFRRFLEKAAETNVDLAVTPEYSLPWATLIAILRAGSRPAAGKLWALGCESITLAALTALRAELADIAVMLFEPLEAQGQRFLDPLVYIFRSETVADGAAKLVLLVQFKTHPMGDSYEIDHLQRGTKVYQFGNIANTVRLISLICSDAFAFTQDDALAIYQRALVLHIQLNPYPRHDVYRRYREKLFDYGNDDIEILCLNWAGGVCEWSNNTEKAWNNPSGSGWYLKPKQFDSGDATVCANHARGLYYTWLQTSRAHALFLNYNPAAYLIESSKVGHVGVPAPVSLRTGPKMQAIFAWDPATTDLVEQAKVADGFLDIIEQAGGAKDAVQKLYEASPIAAERALALGAGKITQGDWYRVGTLDSFEIEATEIVRRITFCQDVVPAAQEFRSVRLMRCRNLWQILSQPDKLPPALQDLAGGFDLVWDDNHPNQNVRSAGNALATAIYLGEEASDETIDRVSRIAADNLWRKAASPDSANSGRQRLAIWYRRDNQDHLYDTSRYTRFDVSRTESEFDFGRQG